MSTYTVGAFNFNQHILMKKNLLFVPVLAAVVSLAAQPVFASDHSGCASKDWKPTSETITSLNYAEKSEPTLYAKKNDSTQVASDLKLQKIKQWLAKAPTASLEKMHKALE